MYKVTFYVIMDGDQVFKGGGIMEWNFFHCGIYLSSAGRSVKLEVYCIHLTCILLCTVW